MKVKEPDVLREALWGLKAIATFMGCTTDRVRSMSKDPDCPIYRPGGQYHALRSELWTWMRSKPSKAA